MSELKFLPGVPVDLVLAAYAAAPGNEIGSGKFSSPESSAFLVANTFGYFLGPERAKLLPMLPGTEQFGWPASDLIPEGIVRFPWGGGKHPCLDVLVETAKGTIGVESKRYEPFRVKKAGKFSNAYWRPVWGSNMRGFEELRDKIKKGSVSFKHLDAVQLIKHAFGLRTASQGGKACSGKLPVLFYLYAEPAAWPDGRPIPDGDRMRHRAEIERFGGIVDGDEVKFRTCSYNTLLKSWSQSQETDVREHAQAVAARFAV